jgi:hypothetical protein
MNTFFFKKKIQKYKTTKTDVKTALFKTSEINKIFDFRGPYISKLFKNKYSMSSNTQSSMFAEMLYCSNQHTVLSSCFDDQCLFTDFIKHQRMFLKGCTRVAQGLLKGCSRVLQGLLKGCSRVPQRCLKGFSKVAQGLLKGCSRFAQGSFKGCSRAAQGLLKGCSRVAQGFFKGCSRVAQGLLKGCSRVAQGLLEPNYPGDRY